MGVRAGQEDRRSPSARPLSDASLRRNRSERLVALGSDHCANGG